MKKSLKFREHLAKLVWAGEKSVTWRLFDNKNLSEGDIVDLVNWNTKEVFTSTELVNVYKKRWES